MMMIKYGYETWARDKKQPIKITTSRSPILYYKTMTKANRDISFVLQIRLLRIFFFYTYNNHILTLTIKTTMYNSTTKTKW